MEDQRRLERAGAAELSEHGSGRLFRRLPHFSQLRHAPGSLPDPAFAPAYDKDRYESTAWTLNGKITDLLKLVYTGSYLDRHIQQQADYSNYLHSPGGSVLRLHGQGLRGPRRQTKPETCYAPVGGWNDTVENTHQSHELRVSSNEDYRLRGLVGAYWEEFIIKDQMNFDYLAIPQCDAQNLAISEAGGPDCVSAVGPHRRLLCDRSEPARELRIPRSART